MRKLLLFAAAVSFAASGAAYAHHSYAATYDVTKEVTLEGKLVQFVYRNPHSFVHVVANDDKGAPQRWAVEWGGTTQLGTAGVTKETLKVGDEVVIKGRPSRVPGEYRALMLTLKRPSDGFAWGSAGQTVD
jgi:DNA/RNA endonuclease YhcR with UshA esterase domain